MTVAIDAHVHVFDRADRSPRGIHELVPPEREERPEKLLERMRTAEVDHAVLVALDEHDDAIMEATEQHPGRFATVVVSGEDEQGRSGKEPVAVLEERRKRLDFNGIRTAWLGEPGRSLADSPVLPMLRFLHERNLPLWSYLPPDQTSFLPEVATLFPDLVVVLNHFGFAPHNMGVDEYLRPSFNDPFPHSEVERVRSLARFPSFRFLFSGQYALTSETYPYHDLTAMTRMLVNEFGADRTMWGSDWPWIDTVPGYCQTRALLDIVLTDATASDRDAVGGGNAAALFGFEPKSRGADRAPTHPPREREKK